MIRKLRLDRRTVLRGILGGAAVNVALPFLDCFLDTNGTAFAATKAPLPVRFGTWFWGCGLTPGMWVPSQVGATYQMPVELEPLRAFRDKLSIFSGFKAMTDGRPAVPHFSGNMSVLSGSAPQRNNEAAAPTIDTLVADQIGSATRFRSLEVACTGNAALSNSRRSASVINPSEISPTALYTRIFGPEFKDPNAAEFVPDPKVMIRESALSAVREDRERLLKEVGAADRQRLDQYFTSLRQLEQQLALQLQKPAPMEACSIPTAPAETKIGTDVEWAVKNHELMAQLLAHALACGQTNVFNVAFSDAASTLRKAGSTVIHHQLTHEELIDASLGFQPESHYFAGRSIAAFATLLSTLDGIREGDGTLLDRCAVFAISDVSYAKIHSLDSMPMMVAGRASGRLKSGWHVAGNGDPVTRVGLTLQQALGLPMTSWGTGSMQTSKTISEIVVA